MKLNKKIKSKKSEPKMFHAAITIRETERCIPIFVPAISQECTASQFMNDLKSGSHNTLHLFNESSSFPLKSIYWQDSFETPDEAFSAIHMVLQYGHDNIATLMEEIPEEVPVCPKCAAAENGGEPHDHKHLN